MDRFKWQAEKCHHGNTKDTIKTGRAVMKGIKNKGFTLIEILVSLAILGIVLAGIYSVYNMQHKSYIVQEQVAEMQQSERIALQMITRDIRMAGLGLSGCNSATGGKIVFNEDINENGILDIGEDVNGNGGAPQVYDGLGYDGSDIITAVYYPFSPQGTAGGYTNISGPTGQISSSAILDVYDNTGFAAGDAAIITSATDGCHYALIRITALPGGGQLQHNTMQSFENLPGRIGSGFLQGDIVRKVISEGGGGIITYAINNNYQLTRAIGSSAPQPLADNIEDMQIAYGIDTDNNRIVEDDEWFNDPTGQDMTLLREIRLALVARTMREDPAYNTGTRPVIENHDPAGSVITTPAQAVRYRRRVLQTTVKLRNIDETVARF